MNKITNEEYILRLEKKNIDIIPIDVYKGRNTKILHRCICGNTWNVTPHAVLSGNKCGCKKFGQHKDVRYYRYKATILYYVKINNIYKIGLVTRRLNTVDEDIARKFGKDFHLVEILETRVFEDGYDAYIKEQSIIYMNRLNKYNGPDIISGGNSGMFIKDVRYFRGSRKKSDTIDFLGNIIKEGFNVLALVGTSHQVTSISRISDGVIHCKNNKYYLPYNIICIESVIKNNAEYFI